MRKLILIAVIALATPLFVCAQTSENVMPKSTEFYAGVALNITKTEPGNQYKTSGGKEYTSTLPAVTAGINIYPRPLTRNFYFGVELSAGQNKYLSVYENKVYPFTQVTYGYNQTFVSLTPQANFNIYNADKFKWFIGAGAFFQRNFYSNKKLSAANGYIFSDAYEFDLSKIQSRIMGKTGFTINGKFQVYGYYLTPVITSNDLAYIQVKMQTTTFGVNYIF